MASVITDEIAIQIAALNRASSELHKVAKDIQLIDKSAGGLSRNPALDKFAAGLSKARNAARSLIAPAAIGGITALGGALAYSVKQAADAEKVQAQLNSVLKSTGGIAGVTADSVNATGKALSQLTAYDDEAIVSAESLLLTFTKIGKDIFPDVTETVLDMSTALGQDLKSSAIQVGKALQDPVKGVTALQRVGVVLSAQQKQQIKDFMAVNDVASAQRVILKELQTEFGGSAKAAGQTFGGQLKILRTNLDNVAESIGQSILPRLNEGAQAMNAFLSEHEDDIARLADMFENRLTGGIAAAVESGQALAEAGGNIVSALSGVSGMQSEIAAAGVAMGAAFAWLFPGAALAAGLVGLLFTLGLVINETDESSEAASKFAAMWLRGIADVIDGLRELARQAPVKLFGAVGEEIAEASGIPGAGKVGEKTGELFGKGVSLGIEQSSPFQTLDELGAESSDALRDRAAEYASHAQQIGANAAANEERANQILIRQGRASSSSLDGIRSSAAGAAAAMYGLTGTAGDLTDAEDGLAAAISNVNNLFAERTLADIGTDRAIAETEALISKYEELGQAVPAELVKWRDQLVANRTTMADVAHAGALNLEELRAKLAELGPVGDEAAREIVDALSLIPEEQRVVVATELNQSSITEVHRVLDIMRAESVTIDVAFAINERSRQAVAQALQSGPNTVGTSRLPTARARGGFVSQHQLYEVGEGGKPELVLPLTDTQRTMDLLKQAGIVAGSREGGGFLDLARGTFAPQGSGAGSAAPGVSGGSEFTELAAQIAASGKSAVQFIAELELYQEQQSAVAEAQRIANEAAARSAIDLTKLAISLGEKGITGEAFIAQQSLAGLRDAFLQSGKSAEAFIDDLQGFTAGLLDAARSMAKRTKKSVFSVSTGSGGWVDEQGNRHTFGGNLTEEGLRKVRQDQGLDDFLNKNPGAVRETKPAAWNNYGTVNNYSGGDKRELSFGLRGV